ncbi:MAG TPA: inorganic diphosphatase [Anaerolineales bacterium]|nr:inorganic diphosphatase [Anaerolineales bacterium]
MTSDTRFWQEMAQLIKTNTIIIDRPKGKPHPHYPDMIYPFDYGYLENTSAGDGDGIDVWIGTLKQKTLTGILCTFDTFKRDAEIKLLIGCTQEDIQTIRAFNSQMHTLYIPNPMAVK